MFQTVKPRARWSRLCEMWMVHGAGVTTFNTTLDGALKVWRGCMLVQAGV